MDKGELVALLKSYKHEITDVIKLCNENSGNQIQSRKSIDKLEKIATKWFDQIEPALRNPVSLDESVINKYREPLGKLLELIGGKPSKRVVLTILGSVNHSFHTDLIVPVQKYEVDQSKLSNFQIIISHAQGLESDYLLEATQCAQLGKKRAAIILGWCAAVYRLHLFIEKMGFDKFNQASIQMTNIQNGRYKRFNKKFEIHNLSELQMSVFDNDLLWILEFLGVIDGNQHERLEICFTMRNTCAHPGESSISEENILSFFSDIDTLVFNNSKFKI